MPIQNMEPTNYVKEFAYKLQITKIKIDFITPFTKGKKLNSLFQKVTKSLIYTINSVRVALPLIYYFTV